MRLDRNTVTVFTSRWSFHSCHGSVNVPTCHYYMHFLDFLSMSSDSCLFLNMQISVMEVNLRNLHDFFSFKHLLTPHSVLLRIWQVSCWQLCEPLRPTVTYNTLHCVSILHVSLEKYNSSLSAKKGLIAHAHKFKTNDDSKKINVIRPASCEEVVWCLHCCYSDLSFLALLGSTDQQSPHCRDHRF